ncbi:hypothetical protein BSU04_42375 [Caballeronia sordidicola]|uniref:Uncharacterized protein n=1 Tax=Caballeronia sordidicola TaxID=196367 RepID=A0A226WMC9_CABSO|nr:hypothetical protein BSU04_42375 [Caballeronia sordidicola]
MTARDYRIWTALWDAPETQALARARVGLAEIRRVHKRE